MKLFVHEIHQYFKSIALGKAHEGHMSFREIIILVILDCDLKYFELLQEKSPKQCFNPCCFGSLSRTARNFGFLTIYLYQNRYFLISNSFGFDYQVL